MKFDFDELPPVDGDVIKNHSKSFSLAAKLLPKEIRSDVEKLYAWCRWCDDAVDEVSKLREASERLKLLRQDVHRIYRGDAAIHPATQWLASVVMKYKIPEQLPLDLLGGMKTDLQNPVLETVEQLLHYCYQAAGTVGLMMSRIMGATTPLALQRAKALGMAMQLTNIARDINEDWQLGRRYVPKKWLSLIPKTDKTPTNSQVRKAVRNLLSLADDLYEEGFKGLKYLPDGARTAIRLAGNVYQEIGNEIRRQDLRVMQKRVFVPLGQKMILMATCFSDELVFRVKRSINKLTTAATSYTQINSIFSLRSSMMTNETRYLGYLGVSLTFVMATTLFLLMGLNPKETVYSSLPWIYSGGCATLAATTGLLARRVNRRLLPQQVTQTQPSKRCQFRGTTETLCRAIYLLRFLID